MLCHVCTQVCADYLKLVAGAVDTAPSPPRINHCTGMYAAVPSSALRPLVVPAVVLRRMGGISCCSPPLLIEASEGHSTEGGR